VEKLDLKSKGEVNTDRNFKNQNKKNSTNENIIKQVTEANDNLSIIDIRKRDFYEVKDHNMNSNKNISITKISDFDNKNIGLLDYINYSPKLNLEVKQFYMIKIGSEFLCFTSRNDFENKCARSGQLSKETKRWSYVFWLSRG